MPGLIDAVRRVVLQNGNLEQKADFDAPLASKKVYESVANRRVISYACNMNIDSILQQIDSEIARLTQARALLSGVGKSTPATIAVASKSEKGAKKKHVLSAEARKRIADAQRKRWAAQKAKAKSK